MRTWSAIGEWEIIDGRDNVSRSFRFIVVGEDNQNPIEIITEELFKNKKCLFHGKVREITGTEVFSANKQEQ